MCMCENGSKYSAARHHTGIFSRSPVPAHVYIATAPWCYLGDMCVTSRTGQRLMAVTKPLNSNHLPSRRAARERHSCSSAAAADTTVIKTHAVLVMSTRQQQHLPSRQHTGKQTLTCHYKHNKASMPTCAALLLDAASNQCWPALHCQHRHPHCRIHLKLRIHVQICC